jgi:hypothetical protein
MNKILAVFGCAFGLCLPTAPAEELVRFPEGDASWIVEIRNAEPGPAESPASTAAPSPRATRVECSAFRGVERYRISWTSAQTTEAWKQQGILLARDPETGRIGYFTDTLVPGLGGLPDASLFSWITGAGEETTYAGRTCLLYRKDAAAEPPGPFSPVEALKPRRAWIDEETRRPLAYDNGLATFLFTYGPASSSLTMPEDFARMHARILGTLSRPPAWAETK